MDPDTDDEKNLEIHQALADLPDGVLASRWKSGDEAAASVLLDRHSKRLVALVASRLASRYRSVVDPNEIVQSAWGSFFDAARNSRVNVSQNVTLWTLLATFVRRKMIRRIEQLETVKRGRGLRRVDPAILDRLSDAPNADLRDDDVDELWESIRGKLPADLADLAEALLAGQTHAEVASALKINERTVRRRINRLRQTLSGAGIESGALRERAPTAEAKVPVSTLSKIGYREFVLGKLIGKGGFGKVYRARMQSNDDVVAVKFLRKAFWQDDAAKRTFLQEIEAAAMIDHPGIIRYVGYGVSPHGGPYILSEWIDGEMLDRVTPLSTSRFIAILIQICEALHFVHQSGTAHGDLTPRNILVGRND